MDWPVDNALWARLSAVVPYLLQGRGRIEQLPRGYVLAEPGRSIERVAFPSGCVISTVTHLADGSGVEVGMTGREGMSAPGLLLGGPRSEHGIMVQIPGRACVVPASTIVEAAGANDDARRVLLGFARYVFDAATQFVACNSLHDATSRYARWLLMASDRSGSAQLRLTQEYSAEMLGVRRPTVTVVAQALSDQGLIATRLGEVRIVDRPGLERAACECYGVVNDMLRYAMDYRFGEDEVAQQRR